MKTKLTSINQTSHIALDIETIPNRPLSEYDPSVQAYLNRKIAKAQAADHSMTYEKFASLHPSFGRIICLSWGCIAENTSGEQMALVQSYTGDEEDILQKFNRQFGNYPNVFVHYNGRSFDIPFILTRMRLRRIACRNGNFADLSQPRGWHHLDLMEFYAHHDPTKRLPLGVLAALTGLPSPKQDLDGSMVFDAFQDGEIRRIARYCEWDVATVLNLLRYLVGGFDPIPPERLYSIDFDGEWGHLASAQPNGSCPSVWDEDKTAFISSDKIPLLGREAPGTHAGHNGAALAESNELQPRANGKITMADLRAASRTQAS